MPKRKSVHGPSFMTGKRANTGRRMVRLPGSSQPSTERSITVMSPNINQGRPTNIPSIFGGIERTEKESIRRIVAAGGRDPETGRKPRSFGSIPKAIAGAMARSRTIRPARKPLKLKKR